MATGRIPGGGGSPLTAKGDLYGYSTTQARVPVGNDGESLVADSSTATGLRYQGNYAAGKNKIINGDFGVWQRGTSIVAIGYTADQWYWDCDGSTKTITRQTFTPGTAPAAGYEAQYFARGTKVAGSYAHISQRIEDVRTFAGQTVTLSFWAKASASTSVTNLYTQNFGSGGSADINASIGSAITLTTDWQRFTFTLTIASVSGKTIGANSYLSIQPIRYINSGNLTFDIWGVQMEAGSTATAFQTATGTIQGELALCQRYFNRFNGGASLYYTNGMSDSTTTAYGVYSYPVTMRATPSFSASGVGSSYSVYSAGGAVTCSAVPGFTNASVASAVIINTVAAGLTAGRGIMMAAGASTTLDFSAEL